MLQALVIMPRRLRFDFALETSHETDPEFFMLSTMGEARKSPSNELLREYASRMLEILVARDSNPKNPNKPFIDCVQPAVKACLALGQTNKLLTQLSLPSSLPTKILQQTTKAMRQMFEEVSFALLEPW